MSESKLSYELLRHESGEYDLNLYTNSDEVKIRMDSEGFLQMASYIIQTIKFDIVQIVKFEEEQKKEE